MRIVVNHLTRMQPGLICVAGVDLATRVHIRPVLPHGCILSTLLRRHGGPFAIGAIVDLGDVLDVGQPPEIEDREFFEPNLAYAAQATAASFWRWLERAAQPSLTAIFGDVLQRHGQTLACQQGSGSASLGVLAPPAPPRLMIDARGRPRLSICHDTTEAPAEVWLPVTDVRLVEDDFQTPRTVAINALARRIQHGEEALLSVGLTRPWRKDGDAVARHWVQVNNIHLKSQPTWDG
ncbi:MAG: hypothetical protein HY332_20795 [Chloroflexi bacterium]|nr:hypothetical protein [Chloroflexota bacterium]